MYYVYLYTVHANIDIYLSCIDYIKAYIYTHVHTHAFPFLCCRREPPTHTQLNVHIAGPVVQKGRFASLGCRFLGPPCFMQGLPLWCIDRQDTLILQPENTFRVLGFHFVAIMQVYAYSFKTCIASTSVQKFIAFFKHCLLKQGAFVRPPAIAFHSVGVRHEVVP